MSNWNVSGERMKSAAACYPQKELSITPCLAALRYNKLIIHRLLLLSACWQPQDDSIAESSP